MVTITKKPTAKPVTKPKDDVSYFADFIDALGASSGEREKLEKEIKALNAKLKEIKDAEKSLIEEIGKALDEDGEPDDKEGIVIKGAKYQLVFGKKGTSRTLTNVERLHELTGDDVFYKIASATLKDIDAYLTPDEKAEVLVETRTARGAKLEKRP